MTAPDPRRLLILGGGSEIGLAFANRCVAAGLERVVLAGRTGGTVDAAAGELVGNHPDLEVHVAPFDGADSEAHTATLASLDESFGPFDTAVVAFGQLGDAFTVDIDPATAARLAHVNFSGAVSTTLAALNVLRGEPNARLVVISSITAVRPRVGNLVYGSAKAGLDAFAIELRAPARDVGVEIVVVRPGFVHTRMTEGLPPAPFATTAGAVADDMFEGLRKGRAVIHSPNILRPVGLVLRNLPGAVWRRVAAR